MSEGLTMYLKAAALHGDVTLDDAHARLVDLDGPSLAELLDEIYTGFDGMYDDVAWELDELMERLGGETPIQRVLAAP